MKTKVFFIALLSFIVLSCSSDNSNEAVANSTSKFLIEGMTCEVGCAGSIEKKLNKTEGVKNCDVDFESKIATVEFDNTKISEEDIKSIIEKLNDGQYKAQIQSSASSVGLNSSSSNQELNVKTTIELPNIFSVLRGIL
ncbi:MAG: heavy-metal-associated domain-containing protein [Bacteroidia bacterium]